MKPQIYRLAAFPLNLILLPGEEIPLRIFEPRYKQLISECLENETPFGIPYINSLGEISDIGSEVEIVKLVGQNDRDDMVISIRGKYLYRTLKFFSVLPTKLYGGTISEIFDSNFQTTNPAIAVLVKSLKLNISSKFGTLLMADSINMNDIARALMLKSEDKYAFLSLKNVTDREQFILNQLRFIELIRKQESQLESNFQLN
jgi:hypothetical protein